MIYRSSIPCLWEFIFSKSINQIHELMLSQVRITTCHFGGAPLVLSELGSPHHCADVFNLTMSRLHHVLSVFGWLSQASNTSTWLHVQMFRKHKLVTRQWPVTSVWHETSRYNNTTNQYQSCFNKSWRDPNVDRLKGKKQIKNCLMKVYIMFCLKFSFV